MADDPKWLDSKKPPYFHWWATIGDTGLILPPDRKSNPQFFVEGRSRLPAIDELIGEQSVVPIPSDVNNAALEAPTNIIPQNIAGHICDVPPQDAVFTVVIDEGIALGHQRFRYSDGTSRILLAWQQGATFDVSQAEHLPFGHELYQKDINSLMRQNSPDRDLRQQLDETGFNRAARLSEPLRPHDTRSISRRASHGTAALDLAAGANATKASDDALRKRPIIAVNLPRRRTIGMAGTFLEYYTIAAINRVVTAINALWDVNYPDKPEGGYAIVVNMSYGQQAGPKDGNSAFEQVVEVLQARQRGRAPLEVVMPAGNDNLMRCNARREMNGRDAYFEQDWRIQPEDHSSNFVEVWTEEYQTDGEEHPLAVTVQAPGGPEMEPWRGKHGEYIEVEGGARIYCQKIDRSKRTIQNNEVIYDEDDSCRFRYVICVPPTADPEPGTVINRQARAGLWKIRLSEKQISGNVYMQVQVDQSAEPDGQRSRRSYFVQQAPDDEIGYATHEHSGRPMDSYAYPFEDYDDSNLDKWESYNHVQRKGTINSIAMNPGIVVVASHRATDGRPSDFSATMFPPDRMPSETTGIDVSAPSDDGAMHLGILAAGTRSGSVVALRGTSFSAPTVARWMVDWLLEHGSGFHVKDALKEAAEQAETELPANWGPAAPPKIGRGRMSPSAPDRRVDRI